MLQVNASFVTAQLDYFCIINVLSLGFSYGDLEIYSQ